MKMARTEMMDNVIRMYGFEDNVTIAFCMYAEDPRTTQESVEQIYRKLTKEDQQMRLHNISGCPFIPGSIGGKKVRKIILKRYALCY